ncbi:hypothetical protein B0H14DRAFT_2371257, partial [Mycena olivaceomarginata]
IVDPKGHIIGVLINPPVPGQQWAEVVEVATAAMHAAWEKMMFPAGAYHHRRAMGEGFPTAACGFAFGGGRQEVGNIKASSQTNVVVMDELMEDPSIGRMATYPILKQLFCEAGNLAYFAAVSFTLLQKNPRLHRTWVRSPFAAVTFNLGPVSVSPPHVDGGNKADGMCLVGALGDFNPDHGGHLVCWDYDLIICFPPGCSIPIPSAVVTHSNTPIQDGEERFSLIQYSAGGLFCWIANSFCSDLDWQASATSEELARREEERQTHCVTALMKFTW